MPPSGVATPELINSFHKQISNDTIDQSKSQYVAYIYIYIYMEFEEMLSTYDYMSLVSHLKETGSVFIWHNKI